MTGRKLSILNISDDVSSIWGLQVSQGWSRVDQVTFCVGDVFFERIHDASFLRLFEANSLRFDIRFKWFDYRNSQVEIQLRVLSQLAGEIY